MILPNKKPVFNAEKVAKVFRYFLGVDWSKKYPVVELAIRNKKLNFYDDELCLWTHKQGFVSFNWNADPSAYIIKGAPKAILKKGCHFYKLSYHHIWDNSKRYVALRPATPGEELPVWRTKGDSRFYSSVAVAINQHKGGSNSTWSEGCQTAHFSQYSGFIQTIGRALNYNVPLGVIKKADPVLTKGLGKFPYLLIDQIDYDYITALDETQFASQVDLAYREIHFVGILIEVNKTAVKIREIPEDKTVDNAPAILAAVEIEAEEIEADEQTKLEIEANDLVSNTQTEQTSTNRDAVSGFSEEDEQEDAEADKSFVQYLPDIDNLKKWFYKQIGGNAVANVSAYIANAPYWMRVGLFVLLILQVSVLIGLVIYHRVYLFNLIKRAMELKSDKSKNNPILTTEKPAELLLQVPNSVNKFFNKFIKK